MPEYIARISFGKDSLKMLDVIITRGLPLDRVTTTDVWATDTIPAELPPVLEAKSRIEEKLWQMYRIEVEHLCARNKDGSKKTYEQMFYHVPVRRSQSVQVERERESRSEAGLDQRFPDSVVPMVSRGAQVPSRATECRGPLPGSLPTQDTTTARNSNLPANHIKGFPLATGVTWCQKLKLRVDTPPLRRAPHEAPGKKYRGIPGYRSGRACPVWSAE